MIAGEIGSGALGYTAVGEQVGSDFFSSSSVFGHAAQQIGVLWWPRGRASMGVRRVIAVLGGADQRRRSPSPSRFVVPGQ